MRALLLAACLAVALTACGTDDGTPTALETPAAARRAADACAPLARAVASTATLPRTEAGRDAVLRDAIRDLETALDGLRALDVPAGDRASFRAMVRHYRTMTRAARELVASEDESVLAAAAAMIVEGQRASRLARRIGLPRCALFPAVTRPPHDPGSPTAAARALVPTTVRPLRGVEACDEQSCLLPYADDGTTLATRIRRAADALRGGGWQRVESGRTPTGDGWVRAGRNDLQAVFDLARRPGGPSYCRSGKPLPGCADSIWVHRVEPLEIPGVLESS
jgi:hypothetical protein